MQAKAMLANYCAPELMTSMIATTLGDSGTTEFADMFAPMSGHGYHGGGAPARADYAQELYLAEDDRWEQSLFIAGGRSSIVELLRTGPDDGIIRCPFENRMRVEIVRVSKTFGKSKTLIQLCAVSQGIVSDATAIRLQFKTQCAGSEGKWVTPGALADILVEEWGLE